MFTMTKKEEKEVGNATPIINKDDDAQNEACHDSNPDRE